MVCYYPLQAYYSDDPSHPIKFSEELSQMFQEGNLPETFRGFRVLSLPCGRCFGCRLERSRQWAIRMTHEAQLHDDNCFITLTYSPENLPEDGSLDVTVFQKFMKRLRKKYSGVKIRFFHCGEYGDLNGRPHYHAILFGFDFDDKQFLKRTKYGALYTSDNLFSLWPYGYSTIGPVNFLTCGYVARYSMKKITGKDAREYYGEKKPEYCTMSRRPGIGHDWLRKYDQEIYPEDQVVTLRKNKSGSSFIKGRPPRYYDEIYSSFEHDSFEEVKNKRLQEADRNANNNTFRRLKVRERCARDKYQKFKRNLDLQKD